MYRPVLILFAASTLGFRPPIQEDLKLALVNNYLGHSIYHEVKNEDPNIFFSPLSISSSLAMLYGGAGGKTRQEITDVLRLETMNFFDVHEGYRNYLANVGPVNKSYIFETANSAWVDKKISIRQGYQNLLKAYYFTSVHPVDFSSEGEVAQKEINQWVADKTHNMITNILDQPPDSLVAMILINAIYFKGTWKDIFDEDLTMPNEFYNYGDKKQVSQVHMMEKDHKYDYIETDEFQAIRLPYKGGVFSMVVVLPSENLNITSVENHLTPQILDSYLRKMSKQKINLMLPKFKLTYSKKLKEVLERLGLKSLFSHDADLSNMTEDQRDLYVSEVTHKAVVEVDEKGSEAAAVTEVEISFRMGNSDKEFRANRPFLFYIVDDRFNLNVFVGRVQKL